jgi:hypothetical protein
LPVNAFTAFSALGDYGAYEFTEDPMLEIHRAETAQSKSSRRSALVAGGMSALLLAATLLSAALPAAAAPDPPSTHASPVPTACPLMCGLPNHR